MSSWEGEEDNTDLYTLKNHRNGERNQDDWDEEYDAGKVKKVKKKQWKDEEDPNQVKVNSFQRLQDFRYHTKVCEKLSLNFSLSQNFKILFRKNMFGRVEVTLDSIKGTRS